MRIKGYVTAAVILFSFSYAIGQEKLDSLQMLKDFNGGGVVFTLIAANAASFGNGYGVNNMAFITALRAHTNAILPVTLSSFKSFRDPNTVKLIWITTSESNSDYFEVLKSTDGKTFSAIGVVKAAGNSSKILTYSFKDVNPATSTNYYKLDMIDLDGTGKKSIIVSSNFDIDKADFNVFANANNGTLSLNIYSDKVKPAIFEVFNLSGSKLLIKNLVLESGSNNFEFKLSTNAKMIIVQLNSEGDKQVKKIFFR